MPEDPAPGSFEALEQGCSCAIIDNNRGKYPPVPPNGWFVTEGCPVHCPAEEGEGESND